MNATESSGHGSVPGRIATGRLRRAIPLPMLMGGVVVFCMPLDELELATQFKPPDGALFLVQSVRRGLSREPRGEWLFFDGDLKLLETRQLPDYRFDPRVRAWFQSASVPDIQSVSDPYVFFTSREIGLTVSQRSNVGDSVLGIDVALSDLGRQLSQLRRTPNSEIAVVDELTDMATEGHLDPQLMLFFIDSRLWYVFACKFLLPEQMDEVGVDSLRARLHQAASSESQASLAGRPGKGGHE